MNIQYNHELDCYDVFFEVAQQKPSMRVYDPDVLKALEEMEDADIDLYDVVSTINNLQNERDGYEATADEYYADAEANAERVSELEDELVEKEREIDGLEEEIRELRKQIKPKKILPTEAQLQDMCERRNTSLDNPGWCVACGEEQDGCEPDATQYECESCGTNTVYAPEELLFRGWYKA